MRRKRCVVAIASSPSWLPAVSRIDPTTPAFRLLVKRERDRLEQVREKLDQPRTTPVQRKRRQTSVANAPPRPESAEPKQAPPSPASARGRGSKRPVSRLVPPLGLLLTPPAAPAPLPNLLWPHDGSFLPPPGPLPLARDVVAPPPPAPAPALPTEDAIASAPASALRTLYSLLSLPLEGALSLDLAPDSSSGSWLDWLSPRVASPEPPWMLQAAPRTGRDAPESPLLPTLSISDDDLLRMLFEAPAA